jgi:hypothetical protein
VRQRDLANSNALLVAAKTLKDLWRFLVTSQLRTVYPELSTAVKIAGTLPVTSAAAERVHSKVKLIKTFIRSTSADDRSADFIQIYVERRKRSELVTNELLTVFATKPRKLCL